MTVKRALLTLAAAVLFLSSLVVPVTAYADEGGTGNCGQSICKP
jgi:hypothetical protein